MKCKSLTALGAFVALCCSASAQILVTFESTGEFAADFQKVNTVFSDSRSLLTQSSNGAGNDFIRHDNTTGSSTNAGAVYMYDTNPGASTADSIFSLSSPLTVNLDFRATTTGSSIGIYFADPGNFNNNLLALFNINSASAETFRTFRDGTPSSSAVGSQTGATQNFATSAPLNGGAGAFTALSFTLSASGTTPTLAMTLGSETLSQAFSAGDFDFLGGNVAVMLRVFDAGTGVANTPFDVDNFAVSASPVPEPSTWFLMGLGGALWAAAYGRKLSAASSKS